MKLNKNSIRECLSELGKANYFIETLERGKSYKVTLYKWKPWSLHNLHLNFNVKVGGVRETFVIVESK